jgi:hypothetical protein
MVAMLLMVFLVVGSLVGGSCVSGEYPGRNAVEHVLKMHLGVFGARTKGQYAVLV